MPGNIFEAAREKLLRLLLPPEKLTIPTDADSARQKLVILMRKYYDGEQIVPMTTRQQSWLDQHDAQLSFVVNHCATVIDAMVERLTVSGVDVLESVDGTKWDRNLLLSTLVWTWWDINKMDAIQKDIYRYTFRDGECFAIVSWDNVAGIPQWTLHPTYVDEQNGGDGYGVWIEYPYKDYRLPPLRGIKRWTDLDENSRPRRRMTLYYPDRIERKYFSPLGWVDYSDEVTLATESWKGADGKPLGIPILHFLNPERRSELKRAVPIQDAYNKAWLDLLASADSSAFRTIVTLGFIPTTDGEDAKEDGSNLLQIGPGQMLSTNTPPTEASVTSIEPTSLDGLLNLEQRIVVSLASVTSTPATRFQSTVTSVAKGTLEQQEGPMVSKVEERQTLFGNAWQEGFQMSLTLAQEFGASSEVPVAKIVQSIDPTKLKINVFWKQPELRDELTVARVGKIKSSMGVPLELILRSDFRLTDDQISKVLASEEYKAFILGMQNAATKNLQGNSVTAETGKTKVSAPDNSQMSQN